MNEAAIQAELRAAQRLVLKQGWRCIDVSYKAVEEVAVELLRAWVEWEPGIEHALLAR